MSEPTTPEQFLEISKRIFPPGSLFIIGNNIHLLIGYYDVPISKGLFTTNRIKTLSNGDLDDFDVFILSQSSNARVCKKLL